MPDFKGYISDLGGPSANMYAMKGYDTSICARCSRPSCLHPSPCRNLNNDHTPLLEIYKEASRIEGVKNASWAVECVTTSACRPTVMPG